MGAFYVNDTVKGADPKSIVGALAGRMAFVCPERSGCVVVFDEESDSSSTFSNEELKLLRSSGRITLYWNYSLVNNLGPSSTWRIDFSNRICRFGL